LKAIKIFSKAQPTLLVIGKPTVLALKVLALLKDTQSIYDAMDDFPSFYDGLSKSAMTRRETAIAKKVTRLIVSSTDLQKKWKDARPDLALIPNGLDPAILPQMEIVKPERSRKTIGYVGTVGAWFDWAWVIALAKSRPDDVVRIIGPIYNQPDTVIPENIELLPACNHKEALLAMLLFDIAIIPIIKNTLTTSVDPIKYYEFRALGLPIISTTFGEMAYRDEQQGVYLCDKYENFNSSIEEALKYKANVDEMHAFRLENSWHSRFSKIDISH
jgi:hypothetical protein